MKASYCKYILNFKRPGGTSRGVLSTKETYFLLLRHNSGWGIGECGLFKGLSWDDRPGYEAQLNWVCEHVENGKEFLLEALRDWPSIAFGVEQAFGSIQGAHPMEYLDSPLVSGLPVPINGLVWMGDPGFMREQIARLVGSGFSCLKLKIGALDFDLELEILEEIRKTHPTGALELRVDANGAFEPDTALEKLERLARLDLHSIEQPIAAGQWREMARICRESPLPIALDEELIGITEPQRQEELLQEIGPQYIILKPSLLGGFRASEAWIERATSLDIGWWVTSALESNIGLNAIAQWTACFRPETPQGLGTGSLFTNNFESPLAVHDGYLRYGAGGSWNDTKLQKLCT